MSRGRRHAFHHTHPPGAARAAHGAGHQCAGVLCDDRRCQQPRRPPPAWSRRARHQHLSAYADAYRASVSGQLVGGFPLPQRPTDRSPTPSYNNNPFGHGFPGESACKANTPITHRWQITGSWRYSGPPGPGRRRGMEHLRQPRFGGGWSLGFVDNARVSATMPVTHCRAAFHERDQLLEQRSQPVRCLRHRAGTARAASSPRSR